MPGEIEQSAASAMCRLDHEAVGQSLGWESETLELTFDASDAILIAPARWILRRDGNEIAGEIKHPGSMGIEPSGYWTQRFAQDYTMLQDDEPEK
jgi:hypothetical protein